MPAIQNLTERSVRQVQALLLCLLFVAGALFLHQVTMVLGAPTPEVSRSQTTSDQAPIISSATIDTRLVHSGTMVLRVRGNGHTIATGDHSMVRVTILPESALHVSVGDPASIRIFIMNTLMPGKVAKIGSALPGGRVPVEISFLSVLPEGAMVDDDVDAAIEYGRIGNTTYMVWGSFMKGNSEGDVFRVEG
jgi:hypothetical protein